MTEAARSAVPAGPGSRPSARTLARPAREPRPAREISHLTQPRRPSTVWVAFLAAATAALAGLAVTGAVVLVGWGLTPSRASARGAVRLALQAWMLAHHGRLQLPLGDVGLTPLGLTLLPAWLLYRAGGSVQRSLSFHDPAQATPAAAAKAVAALTGTYAVLVVLGTGLASTDSVQVEPVSTLAGAGLLAAVAGAAGLLAGSPLTGRLLGLLPAGGRCALRAAAAVLGVLLAAGALLAGAALLADHGRAASLSRALAPGPASGVELLLLGLLCVPNAAVWATGYAVGPGFAIGTGTSVTAFGATLRPVPAFPLLAALPDSPRPPAVAVLVLVVPLLAGALAGAVVGGRYGGRPRVAAGWAAAGGAGAGLALAVLAVLAGGPLGAGRMAALGPSPWQVGLAAAVEVGAVGAAVAAATGRWRRRRPG